MPPARTTVRTAVVWDYLRAALDELGPGPLRVLDTGGGTGGFAVPVAELGHDVTVVDPSPDSLAALERRAAETGTADRITALQGDAAGVPALLDGAAFDLVLCHSVLEIVDDAAAALAGIARAVRAGGVVSVLVGHRPGTVLARVAAGRLAEARALLAADPGLPPRRFTLDELTGALRAAGLTVQAAHGVRLFADAVPRELLDTDPDAVEDLLALERAAAEDPDFRALAAQLHVLARRG